MIIDSVKSFEKYLNLHESFAKVYDFLKKNDLSKLEIGKHMIEEGNVWCAISEKPGQGFVNVPPIEVHDSFIDIHIPIVGTETIGFIDRAKCSGVDAKYDAEKDMALLDETPEVYVTCGPENFVICFPKDGHAPMMGDGTIRKAIFKVRV